MKILKILGLIFLAFSALSMTVGLVGSLTETGSANSKDLTAGGYIVVVIFDILCIYGTYRLYKSLRGRTNGVATVQASTTAPAMAVPKPESGQPKGFFQRRKEEKERQAEAKQAAQDIAACIVSTLYSEGVDVTTKAIATIASSRGLDEGTTRAMVISALDAAVHKALDDDILTEDEERLLSDLLDHYDIETEDMPRDVHMRLVKAAVIRDLLEGTVKPRMEISDMPFKLGKKELLIWAFKPVNAYEHKSSYRYEGGSRGVSIRVAKGLYWRVGNFKGNRVPVEQRIDIGTGFLAVTNKNLFFLSGGKTLRVPHNKIISIVPTGNSVLVGRDQVRSHTLEFETDDNWAFANILGNAHNWD